MTTTAAEHRYRPIGSAHELFGARDAEVLLSGAAGTGKSRACLEKMHAMALANPGMRGLVLRKTLVSLSSTALVTYAQIVAREAIASGEVAWYGGSRREAASWRYSNGSSLVVGGIDKASRIMSSEYDACYVQEATELTLDDWESITTRLRNGKVSFQQLMADCNPGSPHHWLKARSDAGATRMVYCQHEDNPKLYSSGAWTPEGTSYLAKLDNLTGVRKQRLRYGKWAAAEGLVYDGFDPAIHYHPPIGMPPREWTRYWAVDFGYNNPFVCQMWAQDHDGRLYLYRELYATGQLVEDAARTLLAMVRRGDGHVSDVMPHSIVCDHDAEDRATLERHIGMGTRPAIKTVSDGIQAVQARLKVQPDGKPKLYLCRDARVAQDPHLADTHKPDSTNAEILDYIWDPTVPVATGVPREVPLKQNDHGMDAMRYLVAQLDIGGSPRMRFI